MSGGKNQRYARRRMRQLESRRIRREERQKGLRLFAAASRPSFSQPQGNGGDSQQRYDRIIELPENFNLTDNYRESIERINEVREINETDNKLIRPYVDFDHIKKIGAAAALVLAAEFEVANIKNKKGAKWGKAMDDKWDPEVRRLLHDMGFYQLLNLRRDSKETKGREDPDEEFLNFYSGRATIKSPGKALYKISETIGKKFAGMYNLMALKMALGTGFVEAVLNTQNHAYTKNEKPLVHSRWWISASLKKSTDEIKVICYDRGLSIPRTFPKKYKNLLLKFFSPEIFNPEQDAKLIEFAMGQGHTSMGKKGRGNGLPELKMFIDQNNNEGRLIVMSRSGKVTYIKSPNEKTEWKLEKLPVPINGTLIVWSIIRGNKRT